MHRREWGGAAAAQLYCRTDSINYLHNVVQRGQSNAGRQDGGEHDDIVSVISLFCKPPC